MEKNEHGMSILHVIWTLLFIIGTFLIDRVTNNTYMQYIGGRMRPETRPQDSNDTGAA